MSCVYAVDYPLPDQLMLPFPSSIPCIQLH